MPESKVTVFICVTCKGPDAGPVPPGQLMFDAVSALLPAGRAITLTPVGCLAVCKRPCTVALGGPGKWTSIVGDLDHAANAADVISAALGHLASEDGIIPWRARPQSFRKGVVARFPPLQPRDGSTG